MALLLALACVPVFAAPQPAELFVSLTGNDQAAGRSAATPLATLTRARDEARALRRSGKAPNGVAVWVRGGAYHLAETLAFGAEDAGTEQAPLQFRAHKDERPVLRGGPAVSGFAPYRDRVMQCDLKRLGLQGKAFRQLFFKGKRMPLARTPNVDPADVYGGVWAHVVEPSPQGAKRAFTYNPKDIDPSRWARPTDGRLGVFCQYDWRWNWLPIQAVAVEDQTLTLGREATYEFGIGDRYFVEGLFEELDSPGEWYLDRKAGTLTYWPLPGEDMAKAPVVAPVLEQLVRLEGDPEGGKFVEHIALRGLTFSHATAPLPEAGYGYPQAEIPVAAAVYAEGARHCAFEELELAHVGQWGVELSRGCQDHRLVGNRIYDVGCGGLKIGEPTNPERDADEACRTLVTDNRVYDGNAVYMGAPAIWIGQSGSNVVAHNEIHGAWEWGISVGWTWEYVPPNRARDNRIEYNCIHDLGASELGTHAAIYCLGLSPGTVVRNNHLHHVSASGYGIILDQGCCGVLVENNLVHDTDGGFCSNFHCIGNVILNNIFALTRKSQMHRYGDNPPGGFELANTNIYCRNLGYWKEGKLFSRDEWLDFATVQDFNLYWNASGEPVTFMKYSLAEWRAKGLDRSSVIADPLFVDPDNGDFTLKPESPAFKLGFRPLDVSGAGPRE